MGKMDRKKGLIIAIVIAIMLMVGSFAFTRDSEQEDTTGKDNQQQVTPGNDNSGSSEQEDETNNDSQEDEDNSLTVNGDNNSSNTQTGNGNQNGEGNANDEQITDDGYDAAKKAVEAAKESLELNDYKTAEELVGKVTDATKKAELEAELTDIQNSINAIAIVNNLQNQTDSSKNKEDLTAAKDYRTETAIIDLVSKLNNTELKDELTAKLENISKILDDTTAPKIEGIGNNEFTNQDVNLKISDTNTDINEITKTLTLNGNEIAYLDEITEEGTYVLTVMDKAFNKAEVTFTIDKTAPEFEGLEQSGHYESAIVTVKDNLSPVTITVENRNNPGETSEIENGTELKEEATYHITITDKAGNSKDLWIAIDKDAPDIIGVDDKELTNEEPKITITDKFLTSVVIDDKEYTRNDFEVGSNNENFKFTTTISGEGKHTIVAKDKFGHITSKTFTIDQTPANRVHSTVDFDKNPVYNEKIDDVTYYYIKNGASFVFRMRFTEELAENPILNIGNKKVTLELVEKYLINEGKYIYEATVEINKEDNLADGKLSLILSNVIDKAGNKTENPVVLDQSETSNHRSIILDNTKPEVDTLRVKGLKEGNGTTNFKNIKIGDTFQVILTTKEELKTLPTLVIDGQEITEVSSSKFDGYYQYIVSYKIPEETKLANGEAIQFILKGYADAAGNPGKELTNEDIKIGNGQTEVIFDKTAPEVRVLGIAQNGNNPNTNVTNGDSIRIWVYFKEELAVLPKVKLGGKEYSMYHATKSDPYAYILDVVLDDTMKLEQGEIKFEIFGYSDEAGNTKPLTNKNITYTGKNDKLIYDTVKPKPSLIGILNLDNFSTGNVSYAKIGDTVRVRVYFNELLAVEPTITIGGQTYTATLRAGSYSQTYGNAYYADIKLTEDMNLSLGKLKFTISNYQDKAGNVGETENQDSTNENAYKEVTVLSDNTTSIVNGVSYNNFLDALRAANEDNPVVLVSNIEYSTPIAISKNVKIDLNGYDLKLTNSFLRVNNGGKLSIIGKGTVYSDYKEYAPIDMIGSASPDYEDYATLYIGKDVTLKGNSGILVFQATDTSVGYGVNITVEGTIEAVDIDDSSASFGIYIQGMIKNYINVPNITLTNTAKIVSDAVGIYAAGYAVWNVNGAYIEGNESGIAIKSGILNVNSGTIKSTGEDQTPTPGFGNGVYPSGTAIQIESNKGYAGNIEINITGGTIESANSAALYEYLDSKTENTTIKNIKISGGRFITNGIKPSIFVSTQFESVFPSFITGGIFSTNVSDYVMEGYNVEEISNNEFEVVANNN